MTRVANGPRRTYRSALRTGQADETRTRILEATVRVMAAGIATVSIPAVAREAGVSVPTVYRHFGTKRDMLEAVHPYLARRAGVESITGPRSIDDLREGVREIFERVDILASFDDLARAAIASPAAEEARRASMPRRLGLARRLADTVEPPLAPVDRDRLARILVVLTTSSSLRVWRDHLGASVDQAADDVDWVVRAAIRGATRAAEK